MIVIIGTTFLLFAVARLSSRVPLPLVGIARISQKALCRCIPSSDKSGLSRTKMLPLLSECAQQPNANLLRLRPAPYALLGLLWFVTYQVSYGALNSSRLYRNSTDELTTSAKCFLPHPEVQR